MPGRNAGRVPPVTVPWPRHRRAARVIDKDGTEKDLTPGENLKAEFAGVTALDERGAQLADGSRADVDTIIAATGYRTGLHPLVGHLGVLDDLFRFQLGLIEKHQQRSETRYKWMNEFVKLNHSYTTWEDYQKDPRAKFFLWQKQAAAADPPLEPH